MKLSNLLYAGMLSSLALVSCTDNDENSEWTGSEGVVFTTSIQSRVSGNSWNANDKVGIFMTPNGSEIASATVANKKYLAQTNGSLVAAPGEGIYLPATGKVDFIAYYPYSNALSGNVMDVNVADQSKPGAIDLLYSNETKGVEAANGKTIALKFVRKMSKLTLNMTKDETIESFEGLKVEMKGIATEGKFDLANGTVKATDGKNTQAVAMNIGNVEAHTAMATAIILPTAAATDQTKMDLTFTLAGKTFTHSIADLTAFQAGKNVTFGVKLSVNNGKPVVTVGNATIEDWVGVAGGDFNVDFDGEGGGTQPGEEKVLLDEPFDANQGNFTISDIKLPEGSTYVWQWGQFDKDNTQYMKASANINKVNHAAESWLISPSIDLTSAKKATLTFEHCHKYGADKSKEMTLWVADAGTQASAEATGWTQVVIPAYGSGNDYKYVSATIDLTAYVGKSVQVAFRYVSTADAAALWQINSVKVVADGKGGTVDPTPEPEPEPEPQPQPQPGEEKVIFKETCGSQDLGKTKVKINKYDKWDNQGTLTFFDQFAGQFENGDVRFTSTTSNHVYLPAYTDKEKPAGLKISGFDVANYTNLKLVYDISANESADQNIIKVRTNLGDLSVESKSITANKFQTVTLTLPDGIEFIEFVSDASNKAGYRLDNIQLSGIAK